MNVFRGTCTAIVTPFDNQNKVDFDTFGRLIEFQIKNGVDAIVFMGTTGEASTLSEDEKVQVVKFAVSQVGRRVPVIFGAGGNNTADIIRRSVLFEKLGADALLQVTPYYNKATQEGLIQHFNAIAESVEIPVILYNVPARTGVNLLPETVLKLSKTPNIVGIKEASGDLGQTQELFRILPKGFDIYSGDDANIFTFLALGGSGVISVVSNILPALTSDICHKFFDNDFKTAKKIQFEMLPLIKMLFCEVNPIPVKYALKLLGFGNAKTRLPLTVLGDKNAVFLADVLKNYTKV